MTEHEFKSVSALAKYLGISRTTLYKRANSANITLNGTYSKRDLDLLKSVDSAVHEVDSSSEQFKQSNEQNEHHLDTQIEQLIEILTNQLDEKDNQLNTLTDQLKAKDTQIEALNKNLDQAQQLQLIAETRLNEEHTQLIELKESTQQEQKKGFWSRLFNS